MVKILIVDDASFVRTKLTQLLQKNDMETIEASNGIMGVKKYKEQSPDVVLMDVNMPGRNGVKTLKEIMEHDPNAKVIMLTTVGSQNHIMQALEIGAKDYIVKPYKEEVLMKSINKLLGKTDG